MKVVINNCFGGFGLSPLAIQEYARRKGKECYFFITEFGRSSPQGGLTPRNIPATLEEAEKATFYTAYSVPNPEDYRLEERDEDGTFKGANQRSRDISLYSGDIPRDDPDLVAVVEKLGKKANGSFADLKVIEIPDDIDWKISEYDGNEHIAEKHRTWG